MMPARDPWPLAPALSSPTALASPSSRSTPLLSPPLLTMARGVLMLSLRPRLIPTFFMVDTMAMASAMDTATDTPMATTAMASAMETEDTTTESRPLGYSDKLHPA